MTDKSIKWAIDPTQDDLDDAASFLTLLGVGQLYPKASYPAKDLLRAAGLPALPKTNKGVAKWDARINAGEAVPPVLLVRGDRARGLPLIIAEGYHRVSVCYLLGEKTPVAVHFLTVS